MNLLQDSLPSCLLWSMLYLWLLDGFCSSNLLSDCLLAFCSPYILASLVKGNLLDLFHTLLVVCTILISFCLLEVPCLLYSLLTLLKYLYSLPCFLSSGVATFGYCLLACFLPSLVASRLAFDLLSLLVGCILTICLAAPLLSCLLFCFLLTWLCSYRFAIILRMFTCFAAFLLECNI